MKLEIFNKLANDAKESNLVENFIQELSKYLENAKEKGEQKMNIPNNNNESNNEISNEKTLKQQENLNQNREENCLYQVVDFSVNGVYLLNKNTNKIIKKGDKAKEETEISQELKNQIQNDSILRYKNGEYVYEEELTEEFFNNLEDIDQ